MTRGSALVMRQAFRSSVFQTPALYQGTTSVVPKKTGKTKGFNH
jgi:hypothetical protein